MLFCSDLTHGQDQAKKKNRIATTIINHPPQSLSTTPSSFTFPSTPRFQEGPHVVRLPFARPHGGYPVASFG